MKDVPVVIVGGGPVGLTASILLSQAGIRSWLVERHPGTAVHPKARAINARTMEIFHQCGLEAPVRVAGLSPRHTGMIIWVDTLAGEETERRVPWRAGQQAAAVSPVRNCLYAQDDLEPVLRSAPPTLSPPTAPIAAFDASLAQECSAARMSTRASTSPLTPISHLGRHTVPPPFTLLRMARSEGLSSPSMPVIDGDS